eukprot:TRINITY_DN18888_c0_g1_i3.p1 TRINITY_DN18888_c0_g1~~TRINITY_DN18888_c0_g1_i3.p1  ORF type:complete len:119 (+),score=2.58 TRINITY_DN18888_c0_g1_i3:63-419(+)
MSGLWSWLKKKRPDEELLDEYWNDFEKSYNEYLAKNVENVSDLSKTEDFYLKLAKFCTRFSKSSRVAEQEGSRDQRFSEQPSLRAALRKGLPGNLNRLRENGSHSLINRTNPRECSSQ